MCTVQKSLIKYLTDPILFPLIVRSISRPETAAEMVKVSIIY